jgi:UDP-N-acetylglucosamine:LPS N-acetylglucosamine transferase
MKSGNFVTASILVRLQPIAEVFEPIFDTRKMLEEAVDKIQPHLIVSVIPVSNATTLAIAKERNIPMVIIPTDLTFTHFFHHINAPPANFKVALPFGDLKDIKTLISKSNFHEDNFVVTGYPLRREFGVTPETHVTKWTEIRHQLGIKQSDLAVIIMMGAQGSKKHTMRYVETIAKDAKIIVPWSDRNLHVIIMCGENEELKGLVKAVECPPFIKSHALGRKDGEYIAALMHNADILVTKPGGSSVNEALVSEVFTLFDADSTKGIWWEGDNMQFAIDKGRGEMIEMDVFSYQLRIALCRSEALKNVECPGKMFEENFMRVARELMRPVSIRLPKSIQPVIGEESLQTRDYLDQIDVRTQLEQIRKDMLELQSRVEKLEEENKILRQIAWKNGELSEFQ